MLELVAYPDPILTKVCRPLTEEEIKTGSVEGRTIREIVEEMTHIMRNNRTQGIGLASPQVGLPIRLFIVDINAQNVAVPLVFINPELTEPRGSVELPEGCLSLPGIQLKIKRPQMVKVKAFNLMGVEFNFDANGGLARVIQHENDHLDGNLIIKRGKIIGNKKVKEALDDMERKYKRWQEFKAKKNQADQNEGGDVFKS